MNFPQFENGTKPIICSDAVFYLTLIVFQLSTTLIQTAGYMKYQDLLDTDAEKTQGSYILNAFL